MPINHHEIIEDIEGHIRKCGGAWEEWCVGTAKDSRGPFFQRHREADLGDGLTYREAFTPDAAQAVVAHLVNNRGLQLHSDAANEDEGHSALHLSRPNAIRPYKAPRPNAVRPDKNPAKSFSSTAKFQRPPPPPGANTPPSTSSPSKWKLSRWGSCASKAGP